MMQPKKINLHNIQTAHAAKDLKKKTPIKKRAEDLNRHFSKEIYIYIHIHKTESLFCILETNTTL